MPSIASNRAPGISSAVRRPPLMSISVSRSPCITSVGVVTWRRRSARCGAAAMARNWRPGRTDESTGRRPARRRARQRSSSANAGLPHTRVLRRGGRRTTRGRCGGGAVSNANASGVGLAVVGLAGRDITDVIDSSRSGCSMAIVCTIIPPIDSPITCARSTPIASSTAMASCGHVGDRVRLTADASTGASSNYVDSPTSRLSKRTTCRPRPTNISHQSSW